MEFLFDHRHDPAIEEIDFGTYQRALGRPGEFPYTRGIHPDMYTKGNLPTVRKYGGFGSGKELNKYLREQLALGVTGLSIAYDLPTQMGYDPDHALAQGEVGLTGVSIASLDDYEDVFRGILSEIAAKGIGVSKTINATAPILLAFYAAAAKKQGVDSKLLRGTIQNDVLKEYLARNTFIYPLAGALRLVRDVFAWAKENLPKFNTISICGYHMREKGATATQELAYMFANAIEYVVTALGAGMDVDDFAPQLSFFINVKKNLFEEVAKLRAARRIWAQIMKQGFGATLERSCRLRMQSYTGGSDLRAEKPQLNIARDAVRTLAAICGGPQGTNTTSFDEAFTIPTPLSRQIAIDLPYIILVEKAVARVIDPMGGSYYLENLTDQLEAEVWKELERISKAASYQEALASMNGGIEAQAYGEQCREDSGDRKIVGKNIGDEGVKFYPAVEIFTPPGSPAKRQKERALAVQRLRRDRDGVRAARALKFLEDATKNPSKNLMPFLVGAVEARATLGEINDTLTKVFGASDPRTPWEPSSPVKVFNARLRTFVQKKADQARRIASATTTSKVFLTPQDLPYVKKVNSTRLEKPGQFPYTRGISAEACFPKLVCFTLRSSPLVSFLADGWFWRERGATP
ncbi:MAG: methylmalonyl-CoA mutase family protein, partial [Elusimicrobiota bacterium]